MSFTGIISATHGGVGGFRAILDGAKRPMARSRLTGVGRFTGSKRGSTKSSASAPIRDSKSGRNCVKRTNLVVAKVAQKEVRFGGRSLFRSVFSRSRNEPEQSDNEDFPNSCHTNRRACCEKLFRILVGPVLGTDSPVLGCFEPSCPSCSGSPGPVLCGRRPTWGLEPPVVGNYCFLRGRNLTRFGPKAR